MNITESHRSKLNKIARKYSGWHNFSTVGILLHNLYGELGLFDIEVPMWDTWEENRPHKFSFNGEEVENSRFVFNTYKGNHGMVEYNIYFS